MMFRQFICDSPYFVVIYMWYLSHELITSNHVPSSCFALHLHEWLWLNLSPSHNKPMDCSVIGVVYGNLHNVVKNTCILNIQLNPVTLYAYSFQCLSCTQVFCKLVNFGSNKPNLVFLQTLIHVTITSYVYVTRVCNFKRAKLGSSCIQDSVIGFEQRMMIYILGLLM